MSLLVDKSEVTVVSLLLQTVSTDHSGKYECRPDNAPPASIKLHVIKGNSRVVVRSFVLSRTKSRTWSAPLWITEIAYRTKQC